MSVHPRPEHCIPWKCGDAGHTRDDIDNARRSLGYAKEKASRARSRKESAHFQEQIIYWEDVVYQLEHGREDFVGLHLIEAFLNGVAP